MKKFKVEDAYCFRQVEGVLGKSRAKCELFKAANHKGIEWFNKKSRNIAGCFPWINSPQGHEFWRDVYIKSMVSK